MSESELYAAIVEAAKALGWRYFHIPAIAYRHGVRRGFPDLTLMRRGRLIFAELKRENGILAPAQEDWLKEIDAVSGEAGKRCVQWFIWRPSHLLSGEIERTLL